MENSAAEEEKRGGGTYGYLYYSPCYFFEQFIKAFCKCFGKEEEHHHQQKQQQQEKAEAETNISASGTETEMKTAEEDIAMESATTSRAIKITRRTPPRPPPSSGSGGRIN